MNRTATLLVAALLPGLLAGCGRTAEPTAGSGPELTREEFIEIVTAIRVAERAVAEERTVAGEDSAGARFADRKAEILERYGVTEAELREFVLTHGADVALLQETWDTIAQRLKHVPGDPADTMGAVPAVGDPVTGDSADGGAGPAGGGPDAVPGPDRLMDRIGPDELLRRRSVGPDHPLLIRKDSAGERRLH